MKTEEAIKNWNDGVASALKGTPFQIYWEDTEALDWEYARCMVERPEDEAKILAEWAKTLLG